MITTSATVHAFNNSPLRVWGDISSVYRTRDFDAGKSQTSDWLNQSSIHASSYIWQPWFALINTGLTFSVDDFEATDQPAVRDKFTTGNLLFELFPTSRFPFSMYANHSRNELDDNFFTRDISNTEVGLTQQYRSLSGRNHYRVNYKHNDRDDSNLNNFVSDSLFLSSNNQFDNQVLQGDVQYDSVMGETTQDEAISLAIIGRQSFDGLENTSVENLLSFSTVNNDFIDTSSNLHTKQFSSLISWRPAEHDKLRVTGSIRLADMRLKSEFNDDDSFINDRENTSFNINQGLIYNLNEHILISESINASYTESLAEGQFTGNESTGINYVPDIISTILGQYNWSISSNFNNQHGDVDSEQSLSNQFSHSLSEDFVVGKNSILQADISQSYNIQYRSHNEHDETVDHSLSLSWTESTNSSNSVVRFLFNDSTTEGQEKVSFKLLNLQVAGQFRFNRLSSLNANLTLQQTTQQTGQHNKQQKTVNRVSNGQINFLRNRLLQLPRLNFRSELKFSRQQSDNEKIFSSLKSTEPQSDISWKNNLDYRIGRFDSELSINFIKNDDDYDRLIKIQFTRSFGDL